MLYLKIIVFIFCVLAIKSAQANDQAPSIEEIGDLPYKYVGNSFSRKFHRPSCPFAKVMNVNKMILYHRRCEAVADNCVPCRYCLPPYTLSVKSSLLNFSKTKSDDESI